MKNPFKKVDPGTCIIFAFLIVIAIYAISTVPPQAEAAISTANVATEYILEIECEHEWSEMYYLTQKPTCDVGDQYISCKDIGPGFEATVSMRSISLVAFQQHTVAKTGVCSLDIAVSKYNWVVATEGAYRLEESEIMKLKSFIDN